MTSVTSENSGKQFSSNDGNVPKVIVIYTLLSTIIATTVFIVILAYMPNELESVDQHDLTQTFILTIILMFIAGVLGGCLYSFRGLIKHSADADYLESYNLSYFFRPLAGGLSGLMVFFLLVGGAMTLTLGVSSTYSWGTFEGRLPYIALSMLAGYGSHEFMLKLKDVAESIFSLSKKGE